MADQMLLERLNECAQSVHVGGETEEDEPPEEGKSIIRTINQAVLFEIVVVTRPAYQETEVEEARAWTAAAPGLIRPDPHPLYRWRL
ncbi:MAG: HK97 family phage prohead protease [Pseudomonadota bacterium]